MGTLPQLLEEDIQRLDEVLLEYLKHTEVTTTLVIDKGGFLITSAGDQEQFDLTSIAALASGAFLANQTIASMVHEENFSSVYQQGEKFSMFVTSVDDDSLLVIIFRVGISVGAVKYFAMPTALKISEQMRAARNRAPGCGLDLSMLNVADTREIFKKRG